MEELDPKKLGECDGKEGRPAYAAVDGKVYDLSGSKMWPDGEHMGVHQAGYDLSEAIGAAPHGKEVLERVKEVGELKAAAPSAQAPPAWARKLLKLHLHPITVHFPQAFFTSAPIFMCLFYIFHNPHFERTSFYLLMAGWITALPAIKTGIFHWIYKHGTSKSGLYLFKLVMSFVLLFYSGAVLYLHYAAGVLPQDPVNVLLLVLYLGILPMTGAIGHAGGKIAFG